MIKVLDTVVASGAPAERAVLISDLHIGADGGRVVAALDRAIAVASESKSALFVLGDLFDSYVCRGQIKVGVWQDVAARFRTAAAAGLRIVVLVGNRDFLLGEEFAVASGAELVAGGYRLELGGVDTLLVHGDELCQNDLPYQRAKRWLRHPLTRWVARRLPVALARVVAEKARQKSQKVIHSGDQTRFLPSEKAVAEAFGLGAQRLIFGHIHRHSRGPFAAGHYHVLPAFDAGAVGMLVDESDWQPVNFLSAKPQSVDVPPVCAWSN